MVHRKLGAIALALSVAVVACGRSDDEAADTTAAAETTAAPAETTAAPETTAAAGGDTTAAPAETTAAPETTVADPCAGVTLEETEIGVSADTITVLVMADVGSELAPGLFQGNIDGARAWADEVNANGGLGCRQVELLEWDSKINPTESTNGFLEACSKAVAMVGSNSLFIGDVSILATCKDMAGNESGIADIPERAVDAAHQCSPFVFSVSSIGGSCPWTGGVRDYKVQVGPFRQYEKIAGTDLHGIYLVPSDIPSTIESSMPTLKGMELEGFVSDGHFGVSGRAEQATYAEYVNAMKAAGSNLAYNGSNDQAMIKLMSEAAAQGFDTSSAMFVCSIACYTDAFKNDPNTDGTYLWLPFLPFEERDVNPEIGKFLDRIDQDFPASWAVGAWAAGRAFEQAINTIVAEDGPNGITRARVIEIMGTIDSFDANGWYAITDFSQKTFSPCLMLMQLKDGEYVRLYPEEPGTMDCDPANIIDWSGDSAAEFAG